MTPPRLRFQRLGDSEAARTIADQLVAAGHAHSDHPELVIDGPGKISLATTTAPDGDVELTVLPVAQWWLISAADELGTTIASMLATEVGVTPVFVHSPHLVAARLEDSLAAVRALRQLTPDIDPADLLEYLKDQQ